MFSPLQDVLSRPLIIATLLTALASQTSAAPFLADLGNLHLPVINTQPHTTFNIGSQSILIGELSSYPGGMTQAIIDALNSVCDPSSTSCDPTTPPTIGNINYGLQNGPSIQTGTLTLTVHQSTYVGTAQRDALISLIATGFSSTATGSNCQDVSFQQGCRKNKRVVKDGGNGGPDTSGPQVCDTITVTNCNAATFASAAIITFDGSDDINTPVSPLDFEASSNMAVTISFEGSDEPFVFDCSGFLDTINSNIEALPAVSEVAEPVLGVVTAVCKDIDALGL